MTLGFRHASAASRPGRLEIPAVDALVREKLLASGSLQRVTLEGEILIGRRDAGVANKHREFSNGFSEPASPRFVAAAELDAVCGGRLLCRIEVNSAQLPRPTRVFKHSQVFVNRSGRILNYESELTNRTV